LREICPERLAGARKGVLVCAGTAFVVMYLSVILVIALITRR
jgi:hypothetical protein